MTATAAGPGSGPGTPAASALGGLLETVAAAAPGPAVAVVAVRAGGPALLCRGADLATRFELGSVTKTFTALLLAEMAARGEVRHDDPIGAHLPASAVPRGHGDRITLTHLATHTAGLPRLPPGLLRLALPRWYTNPYGAFTAGHLLRALPRTRVRRPPGTRVHYSNFGVGLLGHLLAEAAGADYADVLAARVLEPLGLTDTTCDPSLPQATGRLRGRPRPPWRIPGLPGAGALRSSARDLGRYLEALLSPPDDLGDPLRTALHDVVRPRVTEPGGDRMCLAWKLRTLPAHGGGTHDLLFHSGGTRGFTSFVGFSPTARTALAALTNSGPTLRGTFIRTAYRVLREATVETPSCRPAPHRPPGGR
ncbi:MAG TPA: serine hydrolase domain-containing protein [Streptomyces sp.]|uniref:serine hydrolase domain-containing protein n=1 Tax=Streptomyces sp. TaxID=1931 RepID=UPI002D6B82E7|nr:serine hydrolase domain-containing protein [Streptomyces sp.]HZG05695.1 serine hydrolase domain-containing protein [Streptomyces sp.]